MGFLDFVLGHPAPYHYALRAHVDKVGLVCYYSYDPIDAGRCGTACELLLPDTISISW